MINKNELAKKINDLKGLTNDEKSALVELLRTQKKYGLVWEDKIENVEKRLLENLPVLTEVKERAIISDSPDAPNHILIEGDNLEALTALSYTHGEKIDVIYIDPPYNTGNKDFVYNDHYVDKEDSYRHSKWLSFMNKRLKIAKQLLSDKGVIFISIDDNEQAQLKLLCDEIFGNLDFVATIPWRKRTAKSDVPHYLSQDYEWVLCYAKTNYEAGIKKETRKYFETQDFPGKQWRIHDLTKQTTAEERPNSFFTIINPKTGEEYPASRNRTWAVTKDTFDYYYKINRIVFPGDYDFLKIDRPVLRYWKDEDDKKLGERAGFVSVSSHIAEFVGMTQDGTKNVTEIFGEKAFGFPKPLSLICYLLKISNPHDNNSTILDFFAGSGTTLHATMQLNAEDGGHRKCILVTNNENNICENVTYERNKRVISGYVTPKGKEVEGLKANNLRYYKTAFVSRERTNENMRKLVSLATDMLCIRNDVYIEKSFGNVISRELVRYFEDDKTQMLVVYHEEVIPAIVEMIGTVPKRKEKIKVYVFSPNRYAYNDEFYDVEDRVMLCALPDAIYEAYKRVLPKKKPDYLSEVLHELKGQTSETEESSESMQSTYSKPVLDE
ncbi:MAG: site-specific DNA-methyltransferase [Prevotella sp.]|nr:site-specific DNA-methyltransferase [Prevotella sp.]